MQSCSHKPQQCRLRAPVPAPRLRLPTQMLQEMLLGMEGLGCCTAGVCAVGSSPCQVQGHLQRGVVRSRTVQGSYLQNLLAGLGQHHGRAHPKQCNDGGGLVPASKNIPGHCYRRSLMNHQEQLSSPCSFTIRSLPRHRELCLSNTAISWLETFTLLMRRHETGPRGAGVNPGCYLLAAQRSMSPASIHSAEVTKSPRKAPREVWATQSCLRAASIAACPPQLRLGDHVWV